MFKFEFWIRNRQRMESNDYCHIFRILIAQSQGESSVLRLENVVRYFFWGHQKEQERRNS